MNQIKYIDLQGILLALGGKAEIGKYHSTAGSSFNGLHKWFLPNDLILLIETMDDIVINVYSTFCRFSEQNIESLASWLEILIGMWKVSQDEVLIEGEEDAS